MAAIFVSPLAGCMQAVPCRTQRFPSHANHIERRCGHRPWSIIANFWTNDAIRKDTVDFARNSILFLLGLHLG
jgi:hypothetical protein